eukprot:SAG25_NODE_849_length_5079_cov_19.384739_5_plen_175_part_00
MVAFASDQVPRTQPPCPGESRSSPGCVARHKICCSTSWMQLRAGVRPVSSEARVGEQIGLPEYARWNHTACGERDISSRCGVSAGAPVRDQSPQPLTQHQRRFSVVCRRWGCECDAHVIGEHNHEVLRRWSAHRRQAAGTQAEPAADSSHDSRWLMGHDGRAAAAAAELVAPAR